MVLQIFIKVAAHDAISRMGWRERDRGRWRKTCAVGLGDASNGVSGAPPLFLFPAVVLGKAPPTDVGLGWTLFNATMQGGRLFMHVCNTQAAACRHGKKPETQELVLQGNWFLLGDCPETQLGIVQGG